MGLVSRLYTEKGKANELEAITIEMIKCRRQRLGEKTVTTHM